ncbi:nucleotidyltransferase domain-containing protein [Xylanibacter ruminicola]|uniref:nucleotidyltransferase domain-containing protein n=1 Tax=Xylanibacter ruminicola TaxID=839 RepID=UPI0021CEA775|nr:nucleotidyltransferase family protein [Xylanibacter ruminicola]
MFLALLRAGLWGSSNQDIRIDSPTDWDSIYQLAQEQSVQGLVLQGIEELKAKDIELSVPKVLLLQWIGEVQVIEQRNKEMNAFVAELIEKLRKEDIYTILVKGQGIAQCYENPLWRASGDVDLLLDTENFNRAKTLLFPLASVIEAEFEYSQHLALTIDRWEIELHGTMRCGLTKKMDNFLDRIQKEMLTNKEFRVWNNAGTEILLPAYDNDIVFIFTHFIKHFFKGGIGLRQICDWCRLLWTYRERIDNDLLEKRLNEMGLITEWKAFAALAVKFLDYPCSAMPLYGGSIKWYNKAKKILGIVIETGNFGHNRNMEYYNNSSYVVKKLMSFWKHTCDSIQHFMIFPLDSFKAWNKMIFVGIRFIITGKQ